jgi:putative redox protein
MAGAPSSNRFIMISVTLQLQGTEQHSFQAVDAKGNVVELDANESAQNTNLGARPMQLLLMALGGCSGVDILSILKKQKQKVEQLTITINGERENKTPSPWRSVHVIFDFRGELDQQKCERACALSLEKYCSVAETLRLAGASITWNVTVNQTINQVS